MSSTSHNALLDFSGLPRFDWFNVDDIAPSVRKLVDQAHDTLERITQSTVQPTWHELSLELGVRLEQLNRAWGMVSHLNGVLDSPPLRQAYNQALPWVSEFWTQLSSDEKLFSLYQHLDPTRLNVEELKALDNAKKNFILGGAQLKGAAKARHAEIQERLAQLNQKFSENLLDATDAFALNATSQELHGVPQEVLEATAHDAQLKGESGHRLTLKMPVYLPIMQFASSRSLRETLYRAYQTRASECAQAQFLQYDNSTTLEEILSLRHEQAQLLGFENYAQFSLASKMAASCEQVQGFLMDLAHKAQPHAKQDIQDMRDFAALHLGIVDPQAWDWTFISERLKEHRYDFSETQVKAYFPFPKVLQGLFQIAQTLFDIEISADQAPLWHGDVLFYKIERHQRLVGQFYLDPYAREGKRSGAWMHDVRSRWLRPDDQSLQTPLAHLVCNFAKGVDGQPALLTHDDVITLFHEFGHGLHHLLTQVNEIDVSGIQGVEWDAVELPSQFMENFCWQWNVVSQMSEHHQNGEAMPKSLFDKMLSAKNFQSALQMLRQVEYSVLDMALHQQALDGAAIAHTVQAVKRDVSVLPSPEFCRPLHSFSHIFAGGYAAGYYSYKWAEVLSADAFAQLEEGMDAQGTLSAQLGQRFRQEILEMGGARDAMASFVAFRGREPQIQALLRHQGLDSSSSLSPSRGV